jgi:hypothetical protein
MGLSSSSSSSSSSSGSNNNNNNNNNMPNIIIKNKKEKTCTLIDVTIPAGINIVQKEVEKKLKYKSLCVKKQQR